MTVESVKNQQLATTKKTFPSLLEQHKLQIAAALPRHLKDNADRYARLAMTAFRTNPKLAECNPLSVYAGVILASQLGLEIGVMGQAYLVPYKNHRAGGVLEAQFIPGWKGYVDLVHRSGRAIVWTGCVYEGDVFEYMQGDSPFIRHISKGIDDDKKITHAYAVGRVHGLEWPIVEIWPVDKIKRHRDRNNKVGDSHYSYKNWEMYCRKVPLLQVIKYLPASVELSAMVAMDFHSETGAPQNLTIDAVAEGLVLPGSQFETTTETTNQETKTEPEQETKTEPAKSEPSKTDKPAETKPETKKAAETKADKKQEAQKKAEPKKEEPKAAETVEEIAKQAAAQAEEQPESTATDGDDDLPELNRDWKVGKSYRGVDFPDPVTVTEAFPKYAESQLEAVKTEIARVGINLDTFVTKRLGVAVGELNAVAMGQLLTLLKGVS